MRSRGQMTRNKSAAHDRRQQFKTGNSVSGALINKIECVCCVCDHKSGVTVSAVIYSMVSKPQLQLICQIIPLCKICGSKPPSSPFDMPSN